MTSKLFSRRRFTLAIEVAKLAPLGARVSGEAGYAIVRYRTLTPETLYMPMHLQAGAWKIDGLFTRSLL